MVFQQKDVKRPRSFLRLVVGNDGGNRVLDHLNHGALVVQFQLLWNGDLYSLCYRKQESAEENKDLHKFVLLGIDLYSCCCWCAVRNCSSQSTWSKILSYDNSRTILSNTVLNLLIRVQRSSILKSKDANSCLRSEHYFICLIGLYNLQNQNCCWQHSSTQLKKSVDTFNCIRHFNH